MQYNKIKCDELHAYISITTRIRKIISKNELYSLIDGSIGYICIASLLKDTLL